MRALALRTRPGARNQSRLLHPQRLNRIDSGGPERRHPGGGERDGSEHGRDQRDRHRIGGLRRRTAGRSGRGRRRTPAPRRRWPDRRRSARAPGGPPASGRADGSAPTAMRTPISCVRALTRCRTARRRCRPPPAPARRPRRSTAAAPRCAAGTTPRRWPSRASARCRSAAPGRATRTAARTAGSSAAASPSLLDQHEQLVPVGLLANRRVDLRPDRPGRAGVPVIGDHADDRRPRAAAIGAAERDALPDGALLPRGSGRRTTGSRSRPAARRANPWPRSSGRFAAARAAPRNTPASPP